jgi:peptidoglycan/xylan/chitin deacetylase (PgdA/CDA1 family)
MRLQPLPVLMYHVIGELSGRHQALGVPVRSLAEQLQVLADQGYALLGLTEAVARRTRGDGSRMIALTFDDGYSTFADALPILQSLDARATLYICPGAVGGAPAWLDTDRGSPCALLGWNDLRSLAAVGMEIGNHGLDHMPLDILPTAEVLRQVALSREILSRELGEPPTSFCYPHGYNSSRTRLAVRDVGHGTACIIGHAVRPPTDLLRISRLMVTPRLRGHDLAVLISGRRTLGSRARSLAYPGWRATRVVAYRCYGKVLR